VNWTLSNQVRLDFPYEHRIKKLQNPQQEGEKKGLPVDPSLLGAEGEDGERGFNKKQGLMALGGAAAVAIGAAAYHKHQQKHGDHHDNKDNNKNDHRNDKNDHRNDKNDHRNDKNDSGDEKDKRRD